MGSTPLQLTHDMRHEKHPRSIWWLVLGLTSFSGFAWFINSYEPNALHLFGIFFVLLFVSCFWILLYLLNNVRRSVLLSLGLTTYLVLQILNLREPLYLILLLACLTSLELLLSKR